MKIQEKEVDGVTVLEISGEMYGGPENMELVTRLESLAGAGKLDVVMDMGKVKWIASTGLGILVRARAKYAAEGGKIKLCNLNDRVLSLLQITKMNLLFEVFGSRDEALASAKS